jgi:anaerobic magnesium-protoporphyrin IX monomethyl ester cyclase
LRKVNGGMKVLLINPTSVKDFYREDGSKLIPYGIVFLAAYGRERGHSFAILDRNVDSRLLEDVVREFEPAVVGLSVMTGPCLRDAVEISRTLRGLFPVIKVVWGGIHPTLLYEQVLRENLSDIVVVGEGEETFVEVLEAWQKGAATEGIPGIAYLKEGNVVRTEARAFFSDLNELPDPAWDLVPMERYSFLTLSTSRGCPFRCTFCYNQKMNGKRRSEFNAERVVHLVRRLHEEYGAGHVDFLEDNFTAGWGRVKEFCELMERSELPVTWACEGRISGMTREKLELMKRSGCRGIRFGVESGSSKILTFLKKDITPEMIGRVIREGRDVGLFTSIYLINGIPGETREDRKKSIELLYRDKPDNVDVTTYRPYPGTELYDTCVSRGIFSPPVDTLGWSIISDQYDPKFDVSGAGWRELHRYQLYASRYLLQRAMEKARAGGVSGLNVVRYFRVNLARNRMELVLLRMGFLPWQWEYLWKGIARTAGWGKKGVKGILGLPGRVAGWVASGTPISNLNVETSRRCNLKCVQCATHSEARENSQIYFNPTDRGVMTIETFQRIVPILKSVKRLNLDNHGEPLMNPGLEDIIATARKASRELSISLTSNFTMMTKDRARSILQAGVNEIQVSVNGVKKSTYEKIMKGSRYEEFVGHLEDFNSVRRLGGHELSIFSACVTVMRSNLEELAMLPGFLSQFGVNVLRVNTLLPFNSRMGEESIYDCEEWRNRFETILPAARREAERCGIRVSSVSLDADPRHCRWPATGFSVSYDGTVSLCWMLDIPNGYRYYRGQKGVRVPFVSLGNVHQRPIREMWKAAEWEQIREECRQGRLPAYCEGCPVGQGMICG